MGHEPEMTVRVPAPHPARFWALGTAAAVWLIMAAGVVTGASSDADWLLHTRIPAPIRTALWAVPGLLALYTLLWLRLAWLTVALLIIPPILRVCSYLAAQYAYWSMFGGTGYAAGWYVAGLHVAMIGLPVIIAYLTREDEQIRVHRARGGRD